MARKARVEGAAFEPTPDADPSMLQAIIDDFKVRFPDEWEGLRLCPLQHGIETIVERLKA